MQRFVDRFAAVYTPAVFVLALAYGTPWLQAVFGLVVDVIDLKPPLQYVVLAALGAGLAGWSQGAGFLVAASLIAYLLLRNAERLRTDWPSVMALVAAGFAVTDFVATASAIVRRRASSSSTVVSSIFV